MIPQGFRPLLAINYEKVTKQPETVYASEKLDGVRVVFFGGVAYSRTLKPLPNKLLQKLASKYAEVLEGCDGEVIFGDKYAVDVLQESTSFCMNANKEGDFKIYLFDKYFPNLKWIDRWSTIAHMYIQYPSDLPKEVHVLEHYKVVKSNPGIGEVLLEEFEAKILAEGGEGVMLRDANGKYKFGRSASKTPELQKLKRFLDMECVVTGYSQLETNKNEAVENELGLLKRSTSKDGKVLVDALGSITCALPNGLEFNVGSGFTMQQRIDFWKNMSEDSVIGKLVKVKYFHISAYGVPLLPTFIGFRSELDV